jgi:hypothetical protein
VAPTNSLCEPFWSATGFDSEMLQHPWLMREYNRLYINISHSQCNFVIRSKSREKQGHRISQYLPRSRLGSKFPVHCVQRLPCNVVKGVDRKQAIMQHRDVRAETANSGTNTAMMRLNGEQLFQMRLSTSASKAVGSPPADFFARVPHIHPLPNRRPRIHCRPNLPCCCC